MKFLVYIFIVLVSKVSLGQGSINDTIWFDSDWKEISKKYAKFYRVISKLEKGYLVKDFYLSGEPQMIGAASSISPELILEGLTYYYSENKRITSKGSFKNNKQLGRWVDFPEGQNDSIVYIIHDDGHKEYLHILQRASDGVYTMVDEMPEYPGGVNEMVDFNKKNIKYPKEARKKGWKGKVFLSFDINENGNLIDARIVKSSGHEILDNEALRVVKLMPKWKPGKQNDEYVKVRITIPFNFTLID